MYAFTIKWSLLICAMMVFNTPVVSQTPGYFKDVFSDGGVSLTSRLYMDAPELLGLSVEYLATSDEAFQREVMITNDFDSNGHLLYPDGAPRFRMIYTNGGSASNHGLSLGDAGRNRVRNFFARGGSYTGSCAGAFIASTHYLETGTHTPYYHIWPGRTHTTGVSDAYTGHTIPATSPLLNYFDFGNDLYVDNVRHNGGCWARENLDFPRRTIVLARYDAAQFSAEMDGKASTWAYKPENSEGRIVITGSHPESAWDGERLNMMQAIMLYALDGAGDPQVKSSLENGEMRVMDLFTEDNSPAFTRIGDRQYHHFTISLPEGTPDLFVELHGEEGYEFNLYAHPGNFAFEGDAQYASSGGGAHPFLIISPEASGVWYIGVECATTVEDLHGTYTGQLEVLNGIAYSLTASWSPVGVSNWGALPRDFSLSQNYPNPFNPATTINFDLPGSGWVDLVVYDNQGREVTRLLNEMRTGGNHRVGWIAQDKQGKPLHAGVYLYELRFTDARGERFHDVKKLTLLK